MLKPSLLGGQVQVVSVAPSPGLRQYTRDLAVRAELVRARKVPPELDNLLKITSDGRKASVFNNPPNSWPASPIKTKIDICADRLWHHYCASDMEAGAQIVFCDLYTPKADDFSDDEYHAPTLTEEERFEMLGVYGRLKDAALVRGMLPRDVEFAHDYGTPRARAKLHAAIRAGEVRVCVGSTALIGLSVNVQDRGVALHHLDCPWRPDELEQRTARFIRQGNLYGEVAVYVYVTEGSYDPVVWQIVEGKARWIAQLLTGRVTRKTVEDVGAVVLTAGLAKAVALGDARVLEKTRLEVELTGLERRWLSWASGRALYRRDVERLPAQIARLRASVNRFMAWAELVRMSAAEEEGLGLWLVSPGERDPERVDTLQDGNSAVRALWLQHAYRLQSVMVGHWRGFRLWLEPRGGVLELAAYADGELPDGGGGVTVAGVGFHAARPVDAMGARLTRESLAQEARVLEGQARSLETRLSAAVAELACEWTMRGEVERLLGEYRRVCATGVGWLIDGVVVLEPLEELRDRVSFRFRWE